MAVFMFFEGKCKKIVRVAVFEPGGGDGNRFEICDLGGLDWTVRGVLNDFTDFGRKGFWDKINNYDELTEENPFILVRGVNFTVALMDPAVKVNLYPDGTFEMPPCAYGEEPDDVRTFPIRSGSNMIGLGVDCSGNIGVGLRCSDGGGFGLVHKGFYGGKVRFVVISGSVVDDDVHAQETVYQYLVDALKVESGMTVAVDALALREIKFGLCGRECEDEN